MMKRIVLVLFAVMVVGSLHAERKFFALDNGLDGVTSVDEQAALLKELGYDGICTRPGRATDELLAAYDKQCIKIIATYVVLPSGVGKTAVPDNIVKHLKKLKGRGTVVWLSLTDSKSPLQPAVELTRNLCDMAAENGLSVVLYPHVGCLTSRIATCDKIVKMAERSNLGTSFTLCHFLAQNNHKRIESAIRSMGSNLKLVQINGANELLKPKGDWKQLIQPLGKGSLDVGRIISLLDEIGYDGPVGLQCYKVAGPARKHLEQSIQAWKKYNKNLFRKNAVSGERRITVEEYRDKMAGGWIGQMVGVGWGAPTEFKFNGVMIPAEKVPVWKPQMVNQYNQDDIYVEMTFLRSMELHGLDVSMRQAGIDFANSGYRLWHANKYGRENLRKGIAPPDSGHPKFNSHADDIDAKLNGAYIVMGLLYGEDSIEKTTVIAMRCGADSDCNPSNAAGIICTSKGMKNLPVRYTSALDHRFRFSHTEYDFDSLLAVCEKLARQAVVQQGGRIEKDLAGRELFVIPIRAPKTSALEQCWEPGPVANSRFTEDEMKAIKSDQLR